MVTRLLKSDTPVSFEGEYYQLHEAVLLPRPRRPGGPKIVIGGNGPLRTLPMAAHYADEWNCVYQTPEKFKVLSARLDELLREQGRQPSDMRRTMMTGAFLVRDSAELDRRMAGRDPAACASGARWSAQARRSRRSWRRSRRRASSGSCCSGCRWRTSRAWRLSLRPYVSMRV